MFLSRVKLLLLENDYEMSDLNLNITLPLKGLKYMIELWTVVLLQRLILATE